MSRKAGLPRRDFLKAMGAAAGVAAALPPRAEADEAIKRDHGKQESDGQGHGAAQRVTPFQSPLFFNSVEADAVVALVDTLIPKDDVGPGGVEVGIPTFIDRAMAGAFGRGARMYLQGPFAEGTPEQGYQLSLTPAELYRLGIADLNNWCAKSYGGNHFHQLSPSNRRLVLEEIESGKVEFAQVPAGVFFQLLLQNTMEGYFGDPIHGGNRDKATWEMIGFPGVGDGYIETIETYRNKKYFTNPKSIQDLS
ncbi:MAG: gluconate 2-dehydrogenase subunit 3 family protein [Telmatospirillum sp.]|nr:gluconate 2-dehydrogenase subunit 3 family protein [Telmatospirillum sp.]